MSPLTNVKTNVLYIYDVIKMLCCCCRRTYTDASSVSRWRNGW